VGGCSDVGLLRLCWWWGGVGDGAALNCNSSPPEPHPPHPFSNHLDIDAVDALIEGLAMFKGGVLMVRGEWWVLGGGELVLFSSSASHTCFTLPRTAKRCPPPPTHPNNPPPQVSHDQYLIESTVNELWMCEDLTIKPFHGDFDEYKKRLRKMR